MLKFELSEQHLEVISRALVNAPYGQVAPVVAELNKQIVAQQQQQKPAEVKEAA